VATGAPRGAYESDPTRGRRNLADLLAARVSLPEHLVVDPDATRREAFFADTTRFARALELFLRGEVARIEARERDPEAASGPPTGAVEAYLQAYEAAPEFASSRGMLYLSASYGPPLADAIFPRMLARTPDEPRVHQAYLEHLRRTGDVAGAQKLVKRMQERFGAPTPSAGPGGPPGPSQSPAPPPP
jgi:spermidine synthase